MVDFKHLIYLEVDEGRENEDEGDIYSRDIRALLVEEDVLTPEEEGFMEGWGEP